MRLRFGLLAIISGLLFAFSGSAVAQGAPRGGGATAPPKTAKSRRAAPPSKVIALEGDEIVGKVPKPQVFYVLGRSETRYRGLQVRRSFVRKIVESLKRNPL